MNRTKAVDLNPGDVVIWGGEERIVRYVRPFVRKVHVHYADEGGATSHGIDDKLTVKIAD